MSLVIRRNILWPNMKTSSCDKCVLKAPSASFFNVSDRGDELAEDKDDNPNEKN